MQNHLNTLFNLADGSPLAAAPTMAHLFFGILAHPQER
jgi:hypothetical protein